MNRFFSAFVFLAFVASTTVGEAQVLRQLTDTPGEFFGSPLAIDDAGTEVFTVASLDDLGGNPETRYQLFAFNTSTGAGTQILDLEDGAAAVGPSVSDDGQWILISSHSDPTGGNHDQSIELFLVSRDGLTVTQLTDAASPSAGSVGPFALSGNGQRAFYTFNGDNPDGFAELFVVEADGTNRRKITSGLADVISVHASDDGTKAVFFSRGDFTGGNPDGNNEVFKVDYDGTTATVSQLTSDVTAGSVTPVVAGSGNRVAFSSDGNLGGQNPGGYVEVWVVDWNGANLTKLTTSTGGFFPSQSRIPMITDDGTMIVYASNDPTVVGNSDGSYEIFKVQNNGTGRTLLTSSIADLPFQPPTRPEISGSGNRIGFSYFAETVVGLPSNLDGYAEVAVMDADGSDKRLLTDAALQLVGAGDLSPSGDKYVFGREIDPRIAPDVNEIFIINTDGTNEFQVTNFGDDLTGRSGAAIAGDDSTIFFLRGGHIWRVNADGTGAVEIRPGTAEGAATLRLARDGSIVVWETTNNPLGTNPELNEEVFSITADGTTLTQITSTVSGFSGSPEVDATGTWMVFHSDGDLTGQNPDGGLEVFRCQTDGSSLTQITNTSGGDEAGFPTISNDANRIAFVSNADLTGNNSDKNVEVFVYFVDTTSFDQITDTTDGDASLPRISGNGAWVSFATRSPLFDPSLFRNQDIARVNVDTKVVQRLTGRVSNLSQTTAADPDDSGERFGWVSSGDVIGDNGDLFPEVFFADRTVLPDFHILGEQQTELEWTVNSGPSTYDVVRGDVQNLSAAPGMTDLGPVVCLEDDSPDADTFGFEDTQAPAPGQAYFFVYRGSEGPATGPGSWGVSPSTGDERQAGAGSCQP